MRKSPDNHIRDTKTNSLFRMEKGKLLYYYIDTIGDAWPDEFQGWTIFDIKDLDETSVFEKDKSLINYKNTELRKLCSKYMKLKDKIDELLKWNPNLPMKLK